MTEIKCDFCKDKGNWKTVLRATHIQKKDGSDVILCDDCISLYHNEEWDKLTKKIK